MRHKIGVVGLGYVGLPLAVEFSKHFDVVGYDIHEKRLEELRCNEDSKMDIGPIDLSKSNIYYTSDPEDLVDANIYIVTVPTPVDPLKNPNLDPVLAATDMIGSMLNGDDIVVYESTVAPGTTEDICARRLEELSGLKLNKDFKVGFSPERINPGDVEHSLTKVVKIVSGSDPKALEIISGIYRAILGDNVHEASSIKVAESAKILENMQRDVNIALVNEVATLFDKMGISTKDVLEAAGTKWNFAPYRPGLVGGHCIGVDPYYMLNLAKEHDLTLPVTQAAREVNESMVEYVVLKIRAHLEIKKVKSAGILVLGATFKENCPDTRNSKSLELINALRANKHNVTVFDPYYNEGKRYVGPSDVVIFAVAHEEHSGLRSEDLEDVARSGALIVDIPGMIDKRMVEGSGRVYWGL